MPIAAPSGTAIMKATITSAAVTPIASCTCGAAEQVAEHRQHVAERRQQRGLTMPVRGRSSQRAEHQRQQGQPRRR